jgi:2-desacetyl-2-hydroxyethyl bacteriochlorophyllide A dehydrogenase
MIKAKELWHLSNSASELKDIDLEEPGVNQVIVESVFSMISLGSERTVSTGNVPDEIGEQMRVPFMKGFFSFPCTYGYSLVGMVMRGPDSLIGQLVHVMHPHQSVIKLDINDIYPVPGFIPARRATLASNLETAVNAIWDSGVTVGDKVLIVGFGIIGSLIALVVRHIPGIELLIMEKEQVRASKAEAYGFKVLSTSKRIGVNYDVAFNTSASSRGLQTCIDAVGFEGKVVELSWYGLNSVHINLGQSFHYNRKKIISSQVSNVPASRSRQWDLHRRKELVFNLLKNKIFDSLITLEIPFKNAPSFFKKLRNEDVNDIGVVFSYR